MENAILKSSFSDKSGERYDYRISCDTLSNPLKYGESTLYQLGRIHCRRGSEIPVHTQLNYVELTIATDGRGTVFTNGEAADIETGDIYVSFPGDFHAITSDAHEALKYDFISWRNDNTVLAAAMEKIFADRHDAGVRIIRSRVAARIVADAINELALNDEFVDFVLAGMLDRLTAEIIRTFNSVKVDVIGASKSDEKLLCLKLMNYIDNHIYTIESLGDLTEISNYTYNYTSNLFKRVTGDTLLNYYRNRRLETAALLLRSDRFTIGQVASMLHYSSIYSFSLAYKKKYGYAPTEEKTKAKLF